jgi:hypothetical protein
MINSIRIASQRSTVLLCRCATRRVLVGNNVEDDISKWIVPRGGGLEFHAENRTTARFVPF